MDTAVDIISLLPTDRNPVSIAAPLKFGFSFDDFYHRDGLLRLDQVFLKELQQVDAIVHDRLITARASAEPLATKEESALLLAIAPHLDDFIGQLFGIATDVADLSAQHHKLAPLYSVKRLFVQRKAMHKYKPDAAAGIDGEVVGRALEKLFGEPLTELVFARHVTQWQLDEAGNADALELALQYAAWASHTEAGHARHHDGVLFKSPHKLDFQNLVPSQVTTASGYTEHRFDVSRLRQRAGAGEEVSHLH
jgi:hypothetical protein